jgi:predicted nucleic acid-binding protein
VLVLDASAAVELLLGTAAGLRAAACLRGEIVAAPAHLDAEVLSALGRLARAGEVAEERVASSLGELARAPIRRFPLAPLLPTSWDLRSNLTLRDALYVALARRLRARVVTADRRLARAPRLEVGITLV